METRDLNANEQPAAMITVAEIDENGLFKRLLTHPEDAAGDAAETPSLPPEPRTPRAWRWNGSAWLRRAALLDAAGFFRGMDELAAPEAVTALHLPQIYECDLDPQAGYRWQKDAANPHGGAFVPPPRKTPEDRFDKAEPLPAMMCMFVRAWKLQQFELPAPTLAWMRGYALTVDFKDYVESGGEAREFYLWAKQQENNR